MAIITLGISQSSSGMCYGKGALTAHGCNIYYDMVSSSG